MLFMIQRLFQICRRFASELNLALLYYNVGDLKILNCAQVAAIGKKCPMINAGLAKLLAKSLEDRK